MFVLFPRVAIFSNCGRVQRVSGMRWGVPLVGISLYCYQLATPNNSSQVKIHYDIMIWWVIIASKRFSAILPSLSDSQYGQYIFFFDAYCKLLLQMIFIYIHIIFTYIGKCHVLIFAMFYCGPKCHPGDSSQYLPLWCVDTVKGERIVSMGISCLSVYPNLQLL